MPERHKHDGTNVEIVTLRNGECAFSRKKTQVKEKKKGNRQLEDYGFDHIGSLFNIPSRIDFEQSSRGRTSSASKNLSTPSGTSGITKSTTPCSKSSKRDNSYAGDSTHEKPRRSSRRTRSASTSGFQHHFGESPQDDNVRGKASRARNARLMLEEANTPTPPPPFLQSTIPPPILTFQPPSTPSMAASQAPGAGAEANPALLSPIGKFPSSVQPQTPVQQSAQDAKFPNSPVYPVFRSTSAPQFLHPQQSPTPDLGAAPHTCAGSRDRPVRLPLASIHQSRGNGGPPGSPGPLKYSPYEAKKFEEHYKKAQEQAVELKEGKKDEGDNMNKDVSNRLQHHHICAACGKMRSQEYHKAHPLKKGQIPERQYCPTCTANAAAAAGAGSSIDGPVINVSQG